MFESPFLFQPFVEDMLLIGVYFIASSIANSKYRLSFINVVSVSKNVHSSLA